jgi:hypothetical protein
MLTVLLWVSVLAGVGLIFAAAVFSSHAKVIGRVFLFVSLVLSGGTFSAWSKLQPLMDMTHDEFVEVVRAQKPLSDERESEIVSTLSRQGLSVSSDLTDAHGFVLRAWFDRETIKQRVEAIVREALDEGRKDAPASRADREVGAEG